jgi:hypothetical protein
MKKGQSTVVSTVLLILVVVSVGVIIAVFATGFVKKQTEKQKSISALNNLGIKLAGIYSGTSASGGNFVKVIVRRTDNEEIPLCNAGFTFYLTSGDTVNYDSNILIPEPGINKQYDIAYEQIGTGITSVSQIEKIEVKSKCSDGKTSKLLDEGSEIISELELAKSCAKSLYEKEVASLRPLNSQCLGKCVEYAVDLVYDPRVPAIDDNLLNQCADFSGIATKFIELHNTDGEVVRVVG